MSSEKRKKKKRTRVRWGKLLLWILGVLGGIALTALVLSRLFPADLTVSDNAPAYVKTMYLSKNPYSRPAEKLTEVKNIVIHYVGNPGTSAEANRNYFNNLQNPLANPEGTKASAHFIVGLEGEIIQCIPTTEIAYANYPRNYDTVSVEVCHPDDTGEFTEVTRASVVKLTADLLKSYGLSADDVIRHYDVSGKLCPKYYAEHEEAWLLLKEEIRAEMNRTNEE